MFTIFVPYRTGIHGEIRDELMRMKRAIYLFAPERFDVPAVTDADTEAIRRASFIEIVKAGEPATFQYGPDGKHFVWADVRESFDRDPFEIYTTDDAEMARKADFFIERIGTMKLAFMKEFKKPLVTVTNDLNGILGHIFRSEGINLVVPYLARSDATTDAIREFKRQVIVANGENPIRLIGLPEDMVKAHHLVHMDFSDVDDGDPFETIPLHRVSATLDAMFDIMAVDIFGTAEPASDER